jgi:ABC-type microcin C transport system permease subunit YejB
MATASRLKKVTITHPRTGSQFNIEAAIYEPFKAAILQSLKGSKGKSFTDLTDDVAKIIRKKMPAPIAIGVKKSIPWYTISIRLDLETRGIVETFTEKGKKLNRLAK